MFGSPSTVGPPAVYVGITEPGEPGASDATDVSPDPPSPWYSFPRAAFPAGLVICASCGVPTAYMSASEAVGGLAAAKVTVVAGEDVAAYVASPACVAVTVQVPPPVAVTVAPPPVRTHPAVPGSVTA